MLRKNWTVLKSQQLDGLILKCYRILKSLGFTRRVLCYIIWTWKCCHQVFHQRKLNQTDFSILHLWQSSLVRAIRNFTQIKTHILIHICEHSLAQVWLWDYLHKWTNVSSWTCWCEWSWGLRNVTSCRWWELMANWSGWGEGWIWSCTVQHRGSDRFSSVLCLFTWKCLRKHHFCTREIEWEALTSYMKTHDSNSRLWNVYLSFSSICRHSWFTHSSTIIQSKMSFVQTW